MKQKELICVICPNGCQLEADIEEGSRVFVKDIRGHLCEKGPEWAEQELVNPMRTIASNIIIEEGDFPLMSVRTDSPIPLKKIFNVMKEIKGLQLKAPVKTGDILIKDVSGLPCNIIATRNVQRL